jgi:hypothetical protein
VDQGDRLGTEPLGLAGQTIQIEARAQLDRELGPVGADSIHDLAHEDAELARADDEHTVARLDHRQGARLERGAAGAGKQEDLTLGLEHLAQRQGRRFEDLFVEAPVVLDRRRLIHGLDHRERQLRRTGDHENRTRVALGPIDRHSGSFVAGTVRSALVEGWP